MLPHIHSQQGNNALVGKRRGRVAGVDDSHTAIRALHQPGPAGAEIVDGTVGKLLLESGERAERLVNSRSHGSAGVAATVRAQAVPVEGVVPDLGRVVEDAALGGGDHLFQCLVGKVGALDKTVQFVDIGLVVLAVVKFQGLG